MEVGGARLITATRCGRQRDHPARASLAADALQAVQRLHRAASHRAGDQPVSGGRDPPLLGIIVGRRDGGYRDGQNRDNGTIKDTLTNITHLGEYVINTAPEELALAVQLCADELPSETSEIGHAGLHVVPSLRVRVPRIAESKVQFECQLHRMVPFGDSTLVAGEVKMIHAAPGLVEGGRVDTVRYAPLGRIGGRNYCRLTDLVSV